MPVTIGTTGVENYLDESGGAYIKCLLFGEPGVGKTRSSSFWPDPIFAAAENGLMSVADRRVPYALITSTADLEQLIAQVRQEARKPAGERKYSTFIFDTIDSYQQKVAIPEVLKSQRHDSMQLADWGVLGALQNKILHQILQLPMNVVVLCHAKTNDDGEGPKTVGPALQGQLKDTIAAEFDLVGHMSTFYEMVDGERKLRRAIKWHQDPRYPLLKDRSGQLPPFTGVDFSDDDFTTLQQLMFGTGYFEDLPAAEDVAVIPDAPLPADVIAPAPGGPVEVKAPAKKAAVKPEPKPAEKAQKRNVPAAKKTAAPVQETTPAVTDEVPLPDSLQDGVAPHAQAGVEAAFRAMTTPSAPEPGSEADPREQADAGYLEDEATRLGEDVATTQQSEPTEDQAIATVEEVLGAEVIEQAPPAAPASEVKSPQLVGTACGTPARGIAPADAAPGCGKDLGEEEMDYVNIAVMKFKTNLCFDCFSKARKAKAAA